MAKRNNLTITRIDIFAIFIALATVIGMFQTDHEAGWLVFWIFFIVIWALCRNG